MGEKRKALGFESLSSDGYNTSSATKTYCLKIVKKAFDEKCSADEFQRAKLEDSLKFK